MLSSVVTDKKRPLVIIGAGGHAANVFNVASSCGISIQAFVHSERGGHTFIGTPVLSSLDQLPNVTDFVFAMAIGDNFMRQRYVSDYLSEFPSLEFPALVHSFSHVSDTASLGAGTIIMPGAAINAKASIGNFCVIGGQAHIGHDTSMADYSSCGPGVIVAGYVSIGLRSAVALGASVRETVEIGADTVVGSASLLNKSLPNNVVAYGVPAKIIRHREADEAYMR